MGILMMMYKENNCHISGNLCLELFCSLVIPKMYLIYSEYLSLPAGLCTQF